MQRYIICLKSLVLLLAYSALHAAVPGPVSEGARTVEMYDKYELKFNLDSDFKINPFRTDPLPMLLTKPDGAKWSTPGGADVWAQITTPGGRSVKVYGFWDTDYLYLGRSAKYGGVQHSRFIPVSAPHWKVRYAPQELGRHRVVIYARDAGGTSSSQEFAFTCVPGAGEGFVKLS
ncbi:MAG: hypothetical protein WCT06_07530, partial [Armatimonadota bacterium]